MFMIFRLSCTFPDRFLSQRRGELPHTITGEVAVAICAAIGDLSITRSYCHGIKPAQCTVNNTTTSKICGWRLCACVRRALFEIHAPLLQSRHNALVSGRQQIGRVIEQKLILFLSRRQNVQYSRTNK